MTSLLTVLALGILGSIAAAEFCGWAEYVAKKLVIRAARRVPESLKARLEEEWLAELAEGPTEIAKFVFAFSIYTVGTRRIASDGAFLMTRLAKLWIAVAAVAITALLTIAAGLLASLVMGVMLAHHDQWWWPLVINGLASTGSFVPIGVALFCAYRIALYRRRDLRGRRLANQARPSAFIEILGLDTNPRQSPRHHEPHRR